MNSQRTIQYRCQGGLPLLPLLLASLGGCGTDPSSLDECEQELLEEWQRDPPSVGLARPAAAESFDQRIRDLMRENSIPGGAVAVLRDGHLVFAKAYGFGDLDTPQVAHPDSLFRIASLSKPLTAAAALILSQEGQLSLDTHPFEILQDLQPIPGTMRNPQLATITMRQLLNMTAGWDPTRLDPFSMPTEVAMKLGDPSPATPLDTVRYMLDKDLAYTPGSTYCYSNFGYVVADGVIERLARMPYEDYVRRKILEPLGMIETVLGGTLASQRYEEEVMYYDYPDAPLKPSVFPWPPSSVPQPYGGDFSLEQYQGAGAWVSSTIDVLRLVNSLDSPAPLSILTAASFQAMIQNPDVKVYCSPLSGYFGLGWNFNHGHECWSKGGKLPGTTANVTRTLYPLPQSGQATPHKYAFVALLNSRPKDAKPTIDDVLSSTLFNSLYAAADRKDSWPATDLFDQYTVFEPWESAADFDRDLRYQEKEGRYPSRIEGRLTSGSSEYRAQFVPLPHGTRSRHLVGGDCHEYLREAQNNQRQGYEPADLQLFRDASGRLLFQGSWIKWP